MFTEQARHTLSCLLAHAGSLSPLISDLPGCACLREIWLLLRHTLDHSPATVSFTLSFSLTHTLLLQSFWDVVDSLVREATGPLPNASEGMFLPLTYSLTVTEVSVALESVPLAQSDPVVFGWICVHQVARLYRWSEWGREKEQTHLLPHWDIVNHLLPLTFRQVSCLSLSLSAVLHSCVLGIH